MSIKCVSNGKKVKNRLMLIGFFLHIRFMAQAAFVATVSLRGCLTGAPVIAFQSSQLYICPAVTGSDRFSGTTALTQYGGKELSLPVPGPIFTV